MSPLPIVNAWFVVRSKPQQELQARASLEVRGLEVFLPRIVEIECGEPSLASSRRPVPLFPGYLFAHLSFPLDYHRVIWAPGVRDMLSLGGGPVPVSNEVIEGVRERCDHSGIVRLMTNSWKSGDRVEIPNGPFAGLLATVVTVMPRRRRIKLLIDFLAQQTPVEMPLAALAGNHTRYGRSARTARL